MASWLVIALLAVAGTAVLADPQFIFPEDVTDIFPSSRIVSGWEAEEGQIPHQISLRMVSPIGGVSSCGGSIISPGWGITAAHCTATRVTVVIRAGVVNLSRPGVIFETTKYYNHYLYNEALQSVVQPHDIGLLEFGLNLVFSDTIQPIRLQSSFDKNRNYAGVTLTASGWGRSWTNGASPENLNWVYQTGVSNAECSSAFGGSSIIVDSTICSRYYNVTSQSTCQGDSGGPLTVLDSDGELSLVGVTSFVSAWGCHIGMPAGFIRPGFYHDWFTELSGENYDWVPAADSSESAPESSESTPESSESAPESAPESSESTPESSESSPESSESAPESSESSPESSESAPESSESAPDSSESASKSSESSESSPESSQE